MHDTWSRIAEGARRKVRRRTANSSRAGSTSRRRSARSFRPAPITARSMASIVNPQSGLPVLEVGPGTGVITRAILARGVQPRESLRGRIFRGFRAPSAPPLSAASTSSRAMPSISTPRSASTRDLIFDCVISGVPLLNFPVAQRIAYIEDLLDRMPAGPAGRAAHLRPDVAGAGRAAATTRSSISISSSATSRRPSCGSIGAWRTTERIP